MNFWRGTARACGAVIAVAAMTAAAQAQTLERTLAGVRLNTSAQSILNRFGSPSQIVMGEVAFRLPGGKAMAAAQAAPAAGGEGGSPSAPSIFEQANTIAQGIMGMGSGESGSGGAPGVPGVGPFGNTQSTLAKAQEQTWVFDRPGISYEFLLGPEGRILQVKAIGYGNGPNVNTQRGVRLGSTFASVVQAYGYGEEFQQIGPVLVASYKNKAHATFHFMNGRVMAITISSVE